MSTTTLYTLSNSSMTIYTKNTRSAYRNRLSKPVSVSNLGINSLWLALQSITFENTIIPYTLSKSPDIILIDTKRDIDVNIGGNPTFLFLNEQYFPDGHSFIQAVKQQTKDVFEDIYLDGQRVNIHTRGRGFITFISSRFFRFLGFANVSETMNVVNLKSIPTILYDMLNKDIDTSNVEGSNIARFHDLFTKYVSQNIDGENHPTMYFILDRDKNHLIADQVFNINLLKPSIIKSCMSKSFTQKIFCH